MEQRTGSDVITAWPDESREAAQLMIDTYGEPDEATDSTLTWFGVGAWKRIVATRAFYKHDFPAPHTDSVESFVDDAVPIERFSELAAFDGSVVARDRRDMRLRGSIRSRRPVV